MMPKVGIKAASVIQSISEDLDSIKKRLLDLTKGNVRKVDVSLKGVSAAVTHLNKTKSLVQSSIVPSED